MAPPKQLTTLLLLFIANTPSLVVSQSPYYFNPFQNQQPHRFQQNTYQPFTNAPTYYQPTYQSHSPGGGGEGSSSSSGFRFPGFSNLPAPTPPASSPLVTYPTHESTVSGAPRHHHLSSPQVYQPVGNNLLQQSPTSPTTTTFADTNAHFRPSPLVHHNTHIVNGLPRQQFFGNNYEFFRQRHGLTNLPPTTGPFFQPQQSNNAVSSPPRPSPTPSILLSPTSTAQPPRISETKSSTQKASSVSPKPTQPTVVSRFPNFNSLSPFSPAPSPAIQTATTATPPRSISTARPTSPSTPVRVSPAFQFSQFFPESDTNGSNELVRSPLFGEDEEEEVDDDSYTLNNNNNIYDERRQQQQQPQRPFSSPAPIIPHQRSASPTAYTSAPLSSPYKSQPFSNGVNSVNTYAASKDEPAPVRVHNTTPIRIVFNYEQALEALQENPGVRVVVAHTEKNNLTEQEFSTARPAYSPLPSVTTPRPTTSQILYQSTTGRPSETATHRPYSPISSTQRPQQVPTRFDYNSGGNLYTVTGRTTTTAAALENLALELEGRFSSTGRPPVPSLRPNYETVATYATEPTYTESPLKTYQRGPKKYVVVPGGNLFKSQEPRVVVNDLASIHVQTLPPGSRSPYFPTQPTFPARPSYAEYDEIDDVGEPVGEDLQEEIENLSQQLEIATTIPTTTSTTTTTTPRPPRIRITTPTPRLKITTYRPPGTYRTTPRQAPRVIEDDHVIHELPENSLGQEPPQSGRNQPPSYYYNNKQRGGLSGAYQRYEYNDGVDAPPSAPQQQIEEVRPVRRRQRVRGRLIAGSPPRPVQVSSAVGPLGAMLIQPGVHVGPVPFGAGPPAHVPVGPAPALPGPVFRVGPRGRLLRRKIRPRNQQASATAAPSTQDSQTSLAPTSPAAIPDFPPVPQSISSDGPPPFASLYNPSPFIPTQVPFSVTTFRPPQPNLLVQQNLVAEEQDDDRRVVNTPNTFRSRFRFSPSRATTSTTIRTSVEDEEDDSNQYESEEEAPVPQRRRPQQFSTTSTTEKPSSNQVLSDRANILQRQIRFNRNRKSNQNSNNQRNS